jgi:hypothetical protein
MKGDFLMKAKLTDLLSHYRDDTIHIKEKSIVDDKEVLKLTGVTTKRHITMTKRAVSWGIGIAVATMSCFTVYAIESGAIANLKSYFTNQKVPYSYSGTYNQIDKDYIYDNVNTNFTTKVLSDGSSDNHVEVTGYVADEYNMYIMGNLVLDTSSDINERAKTWNVRDDGSGYMVGACINLASYSNLASDRDVNPITLKTNSHFSNILNVGMGSIEISLEDYQSGKAETLYPIDDYIQNVIDTGGFYYDESIDDFVTKPLEELYASAEHICSISLVKDTDTTDNVKPFVITISSDSFNMRDLESYKVYFGDFAKDNSAIGSYETSQNDLLIDEYIEITFDSSTLNESVDTLSNTITGLNIQCDGYTIDGISYSPLGYSLTFKDSIVTTDNQWESRNDTGIKSDDIGVKTYYYPSVSLIYSDGTTVYQNSKRNSILKDGYAKQYIPNLSYLHTTDSGEKYINICLGDYTDGIKYQALQPIDYTNVVSIKINDTVIPLQK